MDFLLRRGAVLSDEEDFLDFPFESIWKGLKRVGLSLFSLREGDERRSASRVLTLGRPGTIGVALFALALDRLGTSSSTLDKDGLLLLALALDRLSASSSSMGKGGLL